ncbi:hypothetical protein TTHERM_00107170 (macronuclear) [Tetrahymena thermophila SB210]|uniref:WD40-repeat-containing domain n=1 Tax=Tetrahymena thermophila (strain SB210) TaxID=312017 RepID=Q233Y8_TETTS|nr:hypothetical protein TTHERM_00107170 [Tetrahymena thermophila SB210]EAR92114.2 hypothetical protein TTHERM_00107170 [Tetrahymena thermophila SB210]|eukprot:XP_001012360.2 hypothetical protein TTHERM_00107170 [Tetrahymena thermophila SB210]
MNQKASQKQEINESNTSDQQDVPFQGQFKRIISSPILNLTAGIVHDEYNNDFYWGTQDGSLYIFRYNQYEKMKSQKLINLDKEDILAGQDNLLQNQQIEDLNQKMQFLNILNENDYESLKEKDNHTDVLEQELCSISQYQNEQNSTSNFLIGNGKLNFNGSQIQQVKQQNNLQPNLGFPNCSPEENKKSHLNQNCSQGDQSFGNLSQQQQQNIKIKMQDDNNKLQFLEQKNQSNYSDNLNFNDANSNKQKKDQIFSESLEIDKNTLDQSVKQNSIYQQNKMNKNDINISDNEYKLDYPQELNKLDRTQNNLINQDKQSQKNQKFPQNNEDVKQKQNIQKNYQNHYQFTQYINNSSTSKQNNQKINKSQFNGQQKSSQSFEVQDSWISQYCQKIKVSDKQVFEIVVLRDVICLSFFGNIVIAIEKKTFQKVYQLKGDPLIYQGISFLCKSNHDEIIVRQDSINGIEVWKINNFKTVKPNVKKLFQTSTSYQDQFHAMLVIKIQLMIYGNNQGTINIINLKSGKIVQSLIKIFKSQIISLSTNKKSQKNEQILIGADSKWNFKIFSLPYMQTITQFNVFNLGFTMPSFHQQLNIVKVLNTEAILISGSSKQAVIYDWKQSKTIKNISYQNSNFYSFINLSKQSSIILIKQLNQQKTSFLITEWS